MRKRTTILLLSGLVAVLLLLAGPGLIERRLNQVRSSRTPVADRSAFLQRRIFVADLHTDSLLWDRDLLHESDRGHVDIPRLIRGNVALQAFTVVTKAPWGLNMKQNTDSSDMVTPLVVLQRWPIRAWTSLKARALFQAQRFATAASGSGGKLAWIKSADDLERYVEHRRSNHAIAAGFLGIEGAQALDGDIGNLQILSGAGFRMMSLTHFTDNSFAGSATGTGKGGLTAAGRQLIKAMEQQHMIVDLAHVSSKTIDDVLAMATRPVLVSHTGLTATCPSARNLTDDQIRRIAGAGGLVGIAYFKAAVCGTDARSTARAIRHGIEVAGVEHIALGSDFDGAVPMPFDSAGLVALTDALIAEGCTEPEITQIMGSNVVRFLLENLPNR